MFCKIQRDFAAIDTKIKNYKEAQMINSKYLPDVFSCLDNNVDLSPVDLSKDTIRQDYLNVLIDIDHGKSFRLDRNSLRDFLETVSTEGLQKLHFALHNVFTSHFGNDYRLRIIKCLFSISKDQWMPLLKQVCFIIPIGSPEGNVAEVTETLTSIDNPKYREQLVNTASRLFKYDTTLLERSYIMKHLAKYNSEELMLIDKYDDQERENLIEEACPEGINRRELGKTDCYYDTILHRYFVLTKV